MKCYKIIAKFTLWPSSVILVGLFRLRKDCWSIRFKEYDFVSDKFIWKPTNFRLFGNKEAASKAFFKSRERDASVMQKIKDRWEQC